MHSSSGVETWKPRRFLVGGWWLVSKMDGKIRGECVWMGRYAMVGVDAEFCSMSLRIMHDSDDSGGKLD